MGLMKTIASIHRRLILTAALSGAAILMAGATAPRSSMDAEWPMAAKDYSNTRFSNLSQITPENARNLKLAFTFSTGVLRGHEAPPLVVNGVMFVTTPYPNYVYALDLSKPGAPLKWKYDPKVDANAQGIACCDVVNRGAAYADGRLFINTLDAQTIAVDAASGKEIWRARLGDIKNGETITMAPLVVKGKVLVGNSGGEYGVRGWVTALNAENGKQLWRAFTTGPDKEVLIGSEFKPFYDSEKGQDLGVKTWPPAAWQIGGGSVWGWLSYDPEANLVYYGTANPGPWNPEQRQGANKWTSGVFARNPDTGQARWFYQFSPHDLHDYDGVNENVVVDLTMDGAPRKVILHPDRNGYVYAIERTTGQVLYANPYVPITTSTGVDLKTGALKYNPRTEPRVGETIRNICPASPGGKDWQPTAYSPRTGYLYIPHQNLCQDAQSSQASYISGTPYVGMDVKMYAGPGGHRGEFSAWDAAAGKVVWTIKEKFPVWSGAVVTAGDVAFYGTMDGWFKAVNARNGALLWQFKTSSGIIGQPISYKGPDGKQYVAVMAGVGGWSGAIVAGDLDPRDGTAALGFVNAMKDLPQATTKGGMLYVFALP